MWLYEHACNSHDSHLCCIWNEILKFLKFFGNLPICFVFSFIYFLLFLFYVVLYQFSFILLFIARFKFYTICCYFLHRVFFFLFFGKIYIRVYVFTIALKSKVQTSLFRHTHTCIHNYWYKQAYPALSLIC